MHRLLRRDDDVLDWNALLRVFRLVPDEAPIDVDYAHFVKPGELLMSVADCTKRVARGETLLAAAEHEIVAISDVHPWDCDPVGKAVQLVKTRAGKALRE